MKTILPIALFVLFLLGPIGILLLAIERDHLFHSQLATAPSFVSQEPSYAQKPLNVEAVLQLVDCVKFDNHCYENDTSASRRTEDLIVELDKEILLMRAYPLRFSKEDWGRIILSLLQVNDERILLQLVAIVRNDKAFDSYLEQLLAKMDGAADPKILAEAIPIFERNLDDHGKKQLVYQFLEKQIFHGTFYGSREIAGGIQPLVRKDNVSIFKSWLAKLPSKTATYTLLKKSIDDAGIREPSSVTETKKNKSN